MPSKRPELVDYFAGEFGQLGEIELKRFFGGWQFRCGGRQFAAYIRDTLYFRVDDKLCIALRAAGSEPFWYDKQGKRVTVNGYQSAPDGALDNMDELLDWAARAVTVI